MNYTLNQQNSVAFCLHIKLKYKNLDYFLPFCEDMSDSIVYFEAEETRSIDPNPDDIWQIDIYLDHEPKVENIQAELDQISTKNSLDKILITISRVEQVDWVSEVQKTFIPIKAGKFFIHPSGFTENIDSNLINIEINAGSAFGTGEHETTSNCLEALSKYAFGKNGLDMGCGSGILAIAMAKLKIENIIALDIDEQAVKVTQDNAKINKVNLKFIAQSDGYESEIVIKNTPFDLICSNILAGPLIKMKSKAAENLNADGIIILAGFLISQQEEVIKAYEQEGLKLLEVITKNDWPAVVMKKI